MPAAPQEKWVSVLSNGRSLRKCPWALVLSPGATIVNALEGRKGRSKSQGKGALQKMGESCLCVTGLYAAFA